MSVPDKIDDLIGLLRSPARPSELGDEHVAVSAMVEAFHSSKGKSTMRSTSRRVRVGVLIATGIVGFSGVAAAGPGGVFDAGDKVKEKDKATTTTEAVVESTTTVADTVVTTTTVAEAPATSSTVATTEAAPTTVEELAVEGEAVVLQDDPETKFDETMCLEGNHGKTVSAVARGELVIPDIEVRDAAHSSCGKQEATEEEPVEGAEVEGADVEAAEADDDEAEAKDKGNGRSNGKGRGHNKRGPRGPTSRPGFGLEGGMRSESVQHSVCTDMKLTVQTFLTLDGVMQAPGGPEEDPSGEFPHGGWQAPFPDPAVGEFVTELNDHASAFLLGRRTFEIFRGYWPDQTDPDNTIATAINSLPKYVVSNSLGVAEATWRGEHPDTARLVTGDVVAAVRALKDEPGDELQIWGSGNLLQTLLRNDLVDRFRLMTFPLVLGSGRRLFNDGIVPATMSPVDLTVTDLGVVLGTYEPAGPVRHGVCLRQSVDPPGATFMSRHFEDAQPSFLQSDRMLARAAQPIVRFLQVEAAGGVLLVVATVAALIWANSPWQTSYESFWSTSIRIEIGSYVFDEDLLHVVNDLLMAVFFFVVGMEIKRELVVGELRDRRAVALPAMAALGGMVVPALIYTAINAGGPGAGGWGIPMATDIAFALGVVALLGSRVPTTIKVLLLTLAIVDDIGAIIVIAVFYSDGIEARFLLAAAVIVAAVATMHRLQVIYPPVIALAGVALWFVMFESGVHATIAGVVMGLLTPARPLQTDLEAQGFIDVLENRSDLAAEDVRRAATLIRHSVSTCDRLIDSLHPWTSYVIVPVFALANAGIVLSADALSDPSDVMLGVAVALVAGKFVGVVGFSWLAVRLGLGRLPDGAVWGHVAGVGALAGIGFTVSLFITGLAFDSAAIQDDAKIGILAASLVAAAAGALVFAATNRKS